MIVHPLGDLPWGFKCVCCGESMRPTPFGLRHLAYPGRDQMDCQLHKLIQQITEQARKKNA